MDDLRSKILAARKPALPREVSDGPQARVKTSSIAPRGNSPFGIYDIENKKGASIPASQAYAWADGCLRLFAERNVRVVHAILDAARQAGKLGLDPTRDGVYVSTSIRKGWNLKPDQLSKGLSVLERQGYIRCTRSRRKGPHAHFVLTNPTAGEMRAQKSIKTKPQ